MDPRKVRNEEIVLDKVDGKKNGADALTKYLQSSQIRGHLAHMHLRAEEGRAESQKSEAAPRRGWKARGGRERPADGGARPAMSQEATLHKEACRLQRRARL